MIATAVWVTPPLGPIWHLDILVLLMSVFTIYHAISETNKDLRFRNVCLLFTSFLLGLGTEHASLRFGGTHCHAAGIVNFSECSSANSVLYYVPWVYICITTAAELTFARRWMFPFLNAMLFFGMCGVYEMQGPLMGWWLWPRVDGIVKPSAKLWQFGDPGNDTRGMVTTPHVEEALGERIYGFPPMAPYFHSAFGFGIAVALLITGSFFQQSKLRMTKTMQFVAIVASVLLGPALGMAWDPPIRILKIVLGVRKVIAVPGIMGLVFLVPLLFGALENPPKTEASLRQLCLFLVPLLNQSYFVYNALIGYGKNIIPGNLKFGVLCVAAVSLIVHGRAGNVAAFLKLGKKAAGAATTRTVAKAQQVEKEVKKPSSRSRSKSRGRK